MQRGKQMGTCWEEREKKLVLFVLETTKKLKRASKIVLETIKCWQGKSQNEEIHAPTPMPLTHPPTLETVSTTLTKMKEGADGKRKM